MISRSVPFVAVLLFGVVLCASFISAEEKPVRAPFPTKNYYNGYSPEERRDKFVALKAGIAAGEIPAPAGPCMLCGDPDVPVEYHSEDYSVPYLYTPPAMYSLCKSCHRFRLHARFRNPRAWENYLAHVRRGGYARDLRDPEIQAEYRAYAVARKRGEPGTLRTFRPYTGHIGEEWFAHLRMDTESLTDPAARPRP